MIKMNCVMTSELISQLSIRQCSMKFRAASVLIAIAFLLNANIVFSQRAVPPLAGKRVHDEALILSAQTVEQLEIQLKQYEDSTSNQIAILIINSLEGDVIEEYAIRVAHYNPIKKEGWAL